MVAPKVTASKCSPRHVDLARPLSTHLLCSPFGGHDIIRVVLQNKNVACKCAVPSQRGCFLQAMAVLRVVACDQAAIELPGTKQQMG